MNYYQKYLKYKIKYSNLKKQVGGECKKTKGFLSNKKDKTIQELLEDKDCNKEDIILSYHNIFSFPVIEKWIDKGFTTDKIIKQIITEDKLVEFIVLIQDKFNEYFNNDKSEIIKQIIIKKKLVEFIKNITQIKFNKLFTRSDIINNLYFYPLSQVSQVSQVSRDSTEKFFEYISEISKMNPEVLNENNHNSIFKLIKEITTRHIDILDKLLIDIKKEILNQAKFDKILIMNYFNQINNSSDPLLNLKLLPFNSPSPDDKLNKYSYLKKKLLEYGYLPDTSELLTDTRTTRVHIELTSFNILNNLDIPLWTNKGFTAEEIMKQIIQYDKMKEFNEKISIDDFKLYFKRSDIIRNFNYFRYPNIYESDIIYLCYQIINKIGELNPQNLEDKDYECIVILILKIYDNDRLTRNVLESIKKNIFFDKTIDQTKIEKYIKANISTLQRWVDNIITKDPQISKDTKAPNDNKINLLFKNNSILRQYEFLPKITN